MRLSSEGQSVRPYLDAMGPAQLCEQLDARGTVRLCSRGLGALRMASCRQVASKEAHAVSRARLREPFALQRKSHSRAAATAAEPPPPPLL